MGHTTPCNTLCVALPCVGNTLPPHCTSDFDCGAGKYCSPEEKSIDLLVNPPHFSGLHSYCDTFSYRECQSCVSPTADCDGAGSCEVLDLTADWDNCGTCGNNCPAKSDYCTGDIKYSYTGACNGGSCAVENLGCQNECCAPGYSCQGTPATCKKNPIPCAGNIIAYVDSDGDGWGTDPSISVCSVASIPSGYVAQGGDCNDNNNQLTNNCNVCGNGVVESSNNEECEQSVSSGTLNCFPYANKEYGCYADCTWQTVTCGSCGNGVCEKGILGPEAVGTCSDCTGCGDGYCDSDTESTSNCATDCGSCGDDTVQAPEACDPPGSTRSVSCGSNGMNLLPQRCDSTCDWSSLSSCVCTQVGCQAGYACDAATGSCVITSCNDGIKDGSETGIDCGGTCPAPNCPLFVGVCGSSSKSCTASGWAACTTASYGPNYEVTETKCDGLDNDCDGTVDEPASCLAPVVTCGNGVIDSGEDCDGSNLNGKICSSFGFTGGTLSCSSCQFDISQCTKGPCEGVDLNQNQACCMSAGYNWGLSGEKNPAGEVYTLEDGSNLLCSGFRSFTRPATVPTDASSLLSGDKAYYAWTRSSSPGYPASLIVLVAGIDGTVERQVGASFYCKINDAGQCAGTPKLALKDGKLNIALTYAENTYGTDVVLYTATIDITKNTNALSAVSSKIVPEALPAGHYKTYYTTPVTSVGFNSYGDYAYAISEDVYNPSNPGIGTIGKASKIWIKTASEFKVLKASTNYPGFTTELNWGVTSGPEIVSLGGYTYYAWVESSSAENSVKMAKADSSGNIVKTYQLGYSAIASGTGLGRIYSVQLKAFGNKIYSSYTYWGQPNPNLFASKQSSIVTVLDIETASAKPLYTPSGTSNGDINTLACTLKGSSSVVDSQFKDTKGERIALDDVRLPFGSGFCNTAGNLFGRSKQCATGICTSNANDKAVCDKPSDCVFNGKCYSDITTVAATYFGSDTALALKSVWKDEVSADVNNDKKNELCDPGQWVGDGGTASGTVTDKATGAPIIDAIVSADSTNQAYHYATTTSATGTYSFSSMEATNYDFTASKAGYISGFKNNIPVQPSQNVQVDFQIERATSNISGYVTNISQSPEPNAVASAMVRIVGTAFTAITDASGKYSITGVPQGTYDLVASKASDGYQDATKLSIPILEGTASVNFTLVKALGNCNNDCTVGNSNVCDASCNGKGLCSFASEATKQACDGTFGLVKMPDGKYVDCCKGRPYTPTKANMRVPSDNVIVTKVPVLFKGKFVNLVIAVFNKK